MASWNKIENSFFEQGADHTLDEGWMSLDEAKDKFMEFGDKAMGITMQGDDESNAYCVIVPVGTQKYDNPGGGTNCYVYKTMLPPDDGTLFADDFAETDDNEWLRPGRGDGLGDEHDIDLFDSISPDDLHQGSLGDCWLISAMAAMAEFPDALQALFDTTKVSPDGHYVITLYSYAEGGMKEFDVDDRLPVEGSTCKYVKITDEGEIWPCLLEKAFAMYVGGYDNLDGGMSSFAMGAMAGTEDVYFCILDEDDDNQSWKVLKTVPKEDDVHGDIDQELDCKPSLPDFLDMLADWDAQDFLMCAGSHQGSDSDTDDSGVVQGHAYTLLQVKKDVAGSGIDLLQLRNPWGRGEWEGDWSDHSDLWEEHPEIAEECGFQVAEDGLFWISYDDFVARYSAVFCAKKNMGTNRGKKDSEETRNPTTSPDQVKPMKVSRGLELKRDEHANEGACGACAIM